MIIVLMPVALHEFEKDATARFQIEITQFIIARIKLGRRSAW